MWAFPAHRRIIAQLQASCRHCCVHDQLTRLHQAQTQWAQENRHAQPRPLIRTYLRTALHFALLRPCRENLTTAIHALPRRGTALLAVELYRDAAISNWADHSKGPKISCNSAGGQFDTCRMFEVFLSPRMAHANDQHQQHISGGAICLTRKVQVISWSN